jgi:hypothetical protein
MDVESGCQQQGIPIGIGISFPQQETPFNYLRATGGLDALRVCFANSLGTGGY